MSRIKQLPGRQRTRRALLLFSFLLFPLTLYYFSPALIVMAASEGVVNGSFMVFGLLFLTALFVGRLWCGWACPAGALQEFGVLINDRRAASGRWDLLKWVLWVPWIGGIALSAIRAGGYRTVDPLYQLRGGLTVLQEPPPPWFIVYYTIVALFLGLALLFGRRAKCHYICWMAPFMILGRRIGNVMKSPALRSRADREKCIRCRKCNEVCSMGLQVEQMVQSRSMEDAECVLCGECVDNCPKGTIRYSFSADSCRAGRS